MVFVCARKQCFFVAMNNIIIVRLAIPFPLIAFIPGHSEIFENKNTGKEKCNKKEKNNLTVILFKYGYELFVYQF